jgi:hypothetical protein
MTITVNVGPKISLSGATGYSFQVVPRNTENQANTAYEMGRAAESKVEKEDDKGHREKSVEST